MWRGTTGDGTQPRQTFASVDAPGHPVSGPFPYTRHDAVRSSPPRVRPPRLPGGGARARLQQERQGEPAVGDGVAASRPARHAGAAAARWPTAGTRTGRTPRDSGLAHEARVVAARGLRRGRDRLAAPRAHLGPAAHELRLRGRGGAAGRGHGAGRPRRRASPCAWRRAPTGSSARRSACPARRTSSSRCRSRRDEPKPSEHAALFAHSRARMPRRRRRLEGPRARRRRAGTCSRSPPRPRRSDAYFFSDVPQVVEYAAPQKLARTADGVHARADARDQRAEGRAAHGRAGRGGAGRAAGGRGRRRARAGRRRCPRAPRSAARRPGPAACRCCFAFLGGLILNLMPCVLPVLSLKVLGFVRQAGETRVLAARARVHRGRAGRRSGRWRALLLALRAGGERIGWGFQLQSPAFVALLAALFLLIALNLLGVFEVGHVARRRPANAVQGAVRPRLVVLERHCSRPSWRPRAPRRSWAPRSASRSASRPRSRCWCSRRSGSGMAAPYLLLSASPAAPARSCRGRAPWMETFKQLHGGSPCSRTVVFLCWLLGQQAGVDGDGAGCWPRSSRRASAPGSTGARRRPRAARARAAAGRAAPRSLVIAGLVLAADARRTAPVAGRAARRRAPTRCGWEPFSVERRDALRAEGTPVFIDFTAAWCLTCQVNERVALETPACASGCARTASRS